MFLRCPHCENEVAVEQSPPPPSLDCDVCGSTFLSEPDLTQDYQSAADRRSFAHYELITEVGRGAYGTVWKARDTRLDRIVAVKIPRASDLNRQEIERFLLEAQATAQLKHPGIVSVHEAGCVEDTVYIATEFVAGSTLSQWLLGNSPAADKAARVCADLADALHHAHEAGVIHRDVKPSNILLDAEGTPFITDFGLAKRETTDLTIATAGSLLGTPAYMSPEQARGEAHDADRRTDVYSLGVVLFQMLTGEQPFRGSRAVILQQVIEADPPHPRRLNASVPEDLGTICMKCLEKAPTRRYSTASEVADELRRWLRGEPIKARPITRVHRLWRWSRRNPVIAGLSVSLGLALIVGLAGIATQWQRANANATDALDQAEKAVQAATIARAERDRTQQYLYVAHMNMVQHAFELAEPQRVLQILDLHRPGNDTIDRRSFEWYYWRRQAQQWARTFRNSAPLNCVALSPDAALLATGGTDGTISLWDSVSGVLQAELREHTGEVYSIVFCTSEPGVLYSCGGDRTIRRWDLTSNECAQTLKVDRAVFSLAMSPNGNGLVCGGADPTIRIIDTAGIEQQQTLTGHFDFVYSVAVSRDGERIASAGLDRTVRVWDARSGKLLHTFEGHVLEVWAVAFSPDGHTLASGSADMTVRLWDLRSGSAITALEGHTGRVRTLAFSPDGRRLVSAGHDRTVRVWDMTAESKPLEVHKRKLDRRDQHFFERMELPNSGFDKGSFRGHTRDVTALAWSANGRTLVSAGADGLARLWSISELDSRGWLRNHSRAINAVAISENGRTMLSGSNDNTARFWDLTTARQVGEPIDHVDGVLSVAVSPDSRVYATGSYDGTIRLGPLTGSEPSLLEGHKGGVDGLCFSHDSRQLASAGRDGTVRVWDVETGQSRQLGPTRDGTVQEVLFLKGGSVVSGGEDSIIRIQDVVTGETETEIVGHTGTVWALAESPDGKLLASADTDGSVRLWDLQKDGALIREFGGHAQSVRSLAFTPDSRTLASGSDDKTIKLWDVETGEPKTTLKGHKFQVRGLAFTPDGQNLVSASLAIRIWHAPRDTVSSR